MSLAAFVAAFLMPELSPSSGRRASNCQPEREVSSSGTPSPRCDPAITRSPWSLLRPCSYLQPAPRLGALKPCFTGRPDRGYRSTPRVLPRLGTIFVLDDHIASGCYPAAYHRMYESWTRHSRRMKRDFTRFPQGEGARSRVSLGGKCSQFGLASSPRLTGKPLRALVMVELFAGRAFIESALPPSSVRLPEFVLLPGQRLPTPDV